MSGPIRNAVSPATTYGLRGQLVNDKGQGHGYRSSQLHPTAVSGLGPDLLGKTANPLAEPAGICQPSFDRNLFVRCRQKPIMPTDWIGLYFCQHKHEQQLYKMNLP